MQYFRLGFIFLLSLCLLATACGQSVELAVDVRTDLVAGVEFDTVRVRLDRTSALPYRARGTESFATPRRVAEFSPVETGRHFVEVDLVRGDEVLVTRRVAARVEASLIVLVVLTRDCRGVMCPGDGDGAAEAACLGGRCTDPECTIDPTLCDPPECEVHGDCASDTACVAPTCVDGVCLELPGVGTCAATEYCQPGVGCLPIPVASDGGVPIECTVDASCDDGFDCTADRCVSGVCSHLANDSVCTAGMSPRCDPSASGADPTTGCVATVCSSTTCVAGPCETAECVDGRCERSSTCADGEMCCGSGVCGTDCDEATACVGLAAGTRCRAARGPCDAEERCDGTSPGCPPDTRQPAATVCRAATGTCDEAETCSGTTDDCPTDGFAPLGTTCTGGSCNGLGACLTGCTPGGACSTGNVCERGELDCSGASPRCVARGFAPSSTVCRDAVGACDVAETCTGSSAACPGDSFAGGSTTCRPSAGSCDVAETCTGSSALCPADGFRSGATECRASAGSCDIAEFCPGSGPDCPTNAVRPSSYECRSSAGVCDVAETCTGSSAGCPSDGFRSGSTSCRASAGVCDVAETCTGSSASCPGDGFRSAGTSCRAAAGVCDVAETCSGSGALCPGDALRPPSFTCRGSAGICDIPETCTGASTSCPADAMSSGGHYGEACCPGSACLEGACVAGRCAVFGGTYALQGEDSDQCVGNPLTGGTCACPPGFVDEVLIDFDGATDEGTGWETVIHHCRSPSAVSGADYRGASGQILALPSGSGCAASCVQSNAYSGSCSCPGGASTQTLLGVHYQGGSTLDCQRSLSLCRQGAPLTYGGAYRVMTDTGLTCLEIPTSLRCEPNPLTGSCSCPAGFSPVTMRAYRPHSDPARYASNWFRRADLTICVDPTP